MFSGDIVFIIFIDLRECVVCNSKFQVIFFDGCFVWLFDGILVLWEKEYLKFFYGNFFFDEYFVVLENWLFIMNVFVFSVDIGNMFCFIKFDVIFFGCEFISVEEIVVILIVGIGYGLKMFYVKIGDLFSVL